MEGVWSSSAHIRIVTFVLRYVNTIITKKRSQHRAPKTKNQQLSITRKLLILNVDQLLEQDSYVMQ